MGDNHPDLPVSSIHKPLKGILELSNGPKLTVYVETLNVQTEAEAKAEINKLCDAAEEPKLFLPFN
jgi:hypothetical protein